MRPRVLLIRLSAIGDVADCLPAAVALRRTLPGAYIGWAVDARASALLAGVDAIDTVLVFPRRLSASLFRLREQAFDVAVDFHGNARSGLLARASGAPRRIGLAPPYSHEGNRFWMTETVALPSLPSAVRHRTLRAIAALGPLGVPLELPSPPFRLAVDPAAAEAVAAWRAEAFGHPDAPFILLHAGASPKGDYKRWPADRFAMLADRLIDRGHRVAFFQGPHERKILPGLAVRMRHPLVATPLFPLAEGIAAIQAARCVVGSDSGPLHIAHGLGRPTVDLFGPKDPADYGPLTEAHRVVYHPLPCSPCRNTTCPHRRCLDLVTVDEVESAALAFLEA